AVEADGPCGGDQILEVAHEQQRQPARDLGVAALSLDRQVGDVLRGGAEDRRHARLVEMASVPQEVRSRFHRYVRTPLERADGQAPVLVHGRRRKGRRGTGDGSVKVCVEEPNGEASNRGGTTASSSDTDKAPPQADCKQ